MISYAAVQVNCSPVSLYSITNPSLSLVLSVCAALQNIVATKIIAPYNHAPLDMTDPLPNKNITEHLWHIG